MSYRITLNHSRDEQVHYGNVQMVRALLQWVCVLFVIFYMSYRIPLNHSRDEQVHYGNVTTQNQHELAHELAAAIDEPEYKKEKNNVHATDTRYYVG